MNTVDFKNNGTADTARLLSRNLWGDFPIRDIREGVRPGIFFYDDFSDLPLAPTLTTQIAFGKYKGFATTGSTISKVSPVNSVEIMGGTAQVTIDTDNDSASLAQAYPAFLLNGTDYGGGKGKLVFEACYAQNSVATNMASVFFGLAEVEQFTLATAVPLNGGNSPTADGSLIGFRIEEDGLGVVDTVYADRATSFTNIGDTEGGTMTAYTFTKYGMVYDPSSVAECITFYKNGVKLTTPMTKTALAALTHLDANSLGLLWATCADSAGTSFAGYMKWWACGQLLPT